MGVNRVLAVVCMICAATWLPCAVGAVNEVEPLELAPKESWTVLDAPRQATPGALDFLVAQTEQPGQMPPPPEPSLMETEEVKPLAITVKNDWVSKYMFCGFDLLDDHGAYQPSIDFGLWETGLHLNFWASYATSSRNDPHAIYGAEKPSRLDEFDYTIYYTRECLDGFILSEVGMLYFDIYRQDSDNLDYWEWFAKFTLAKLPLAPHAYCYYTMPYDTGKGGEGWLTCLGGSHSCELGSMPMFGTDDPVSLLFSGDVWYNGGGFLDGVGTGWSNAVFGGTFQIPLASNMTFSPGLFYQISMEDTIDPDNEWWTQLSVVYIW